MMKSTDVEPAPGAARRSNAALSASEGTEWSSNPSPPGGPPGPPPGPQAVLHASRALRNAGLRAARRGMTAAGAGPRAARRGTAAADAGLRAARRGTPVAVAGLRAARSGTPAAGVPLRAKSPAGNAPEPPRAGSFEVPHPLV